MVETVATQNIANPLSNLKIKSKDKDDKIKSKIQNKELKDKLKFKEKTDKIKMKYKDEQTKLKYKEKPDKIKFEDSASKTWIRLKRQHGMISIKTKNLGVSKYYMVEDFNLPQMSILLNDPNICPPMVAQRFFALLTQARTTKEVSYMSFFDRVRNRFGMRKEQTVV